MPDDAILNKAIEWSKNPYFKKSDRMELTDLIERNEEAEIKERFYQDLSFGTGGMRSIVGFGSNRINVYNVKKASHALALVAKQHFETPAKQHFETPKKQNKKSDLKVAISYDSRNTSDEFSKAAASVFLGHGFTVYYMPVPTPTPILSYAVRHLNCDCGVMLTASHNPTNYNGFKAYWNDGGQLVAPMDKKVVDLFYSISDWNEIADSDFESEKLITLGDDFYNDYFKVLENDCMEPELLKNKGHELSVVYTPLHGTGGYFCKEIANKMGLSNVEVLESQAKPDGSFPTLKFPNPEEPESLKLAVERMLEKNAMLVIGSDPDTDRMGVVYNNKGTPYYLNGNEIGNLMLYYKLSRLKSLEKLNSNSLVLKTIVSSPLQNKICKHFDVNFIDTLTGFKWMGKVLTQKDINKEKYDFVFASEESFGSMSHDQVRDKDGVSSFLLFCELVAYYKEENKTILDVLTEIYKKLGFHQESLLSLSYQGISGLEKIKNIMKSIRSNSKDVFSNYDLESVEDYENLTLNFVDGRSETLNFSNKSNVLGINFKNGNSLYIRPSGTEPKIKFYSHFQGEESNKQQVLTEIKELETFLKNYCDNV